MNFQRKERRWPWLLAIAGLHLAALLTWPGQSGQTSLPHSTSRLLMTFIAVEAPAPRALTAQPRTAPRPVKAPAAERNTEVAMALSHPPSAVVPEAVAPLSPASSAAPALNLDLRAISAALQSEQRATQFPAKAAANSLPALGGKIAAAAVRQDVTLKELTLADGTRMTKVSGPGGTYCVIAPNPAGGATIVQREAKGNRVVTCGNY